MKKQFFPFFIIALFVFAACASAPKETEPPIDPDELIGTTWAYNRVVFGMRFTIQFVDEENCVMTVLGTPNNLTYRIDGNKVWIGKDKKPLIMENGLLHQDSDVFYYKM